jgi:metal-sulfur cluster biosynthetic enzyme
MDIERAVTECLRQLIDPETGTNVVQMRLVEDLQVDAKTGFVRYRVRPSSPLCPLAVPLTLAIRDAVSQVPGVKRQEIEVVGYVGAGELNAMLKEEM